MWLIRGMDGEVWPQCLSYGVQLTGRKFVHYSQCVFSLHHFVGRNGGFEIDSKLHLFRVRIERYKLAVVLSVRRLRFAVGTMVVLTSLLQHSAPHKRLSSEGN